MDQLQRPRSFPDPVSQYTLKEMTIVWHLYGGRDFADSASADSTPASSLLSGRQSSVSSRKEGQQGGRSGVGRVPRKLGGGPGRDHTVLVEVELDKVRSVLRWSAQLLTDYVLQLCVQEETYPTSCKQSSRLVLLVGGVEVRDRLAQSQINKLLYQYTTEARPKQSHASMVRMYWDVPVRSEYSEVRVQCHSCRYLSRSCSLGQSCTLNKTLKKHQYVCQSCQ